MTIERKIDYPKIDVNLINQFPVQLDKSEITDVSSDLGVSFKFVDNEGKTVLLIEARELNFEREEDNCLIHGCFIRKFEFVEELLYSPYNETILHDFISLFIALVRNKTFCLDDKTIMQGYQYIWAEKDSNIQCVIAEILGLNIIYKDDGIVIYKSLLPNK